MRIRPLQRRSSCVRPASSSAPLTLENLEARLTLSAAPGISPPSIPAAAAALNSAVRDSIATGFGATGINSTGSTSVSIDSYSAISNSRMEWITGQSSPDIGYVSANGAYVEYTVNSAGGVYSLALGLASLGTADVKIEVNGVFNGEITPPATGAWSSFATATATIQLNAGNNTVRFTAMNWSQYNIGAITLSPLNPANNPSITSITDQSTINVASYSGISNAQLEQYIGTDIGYVSTNGAYIDYTVNVAAAGNYSLSLGTSGVKASSVNVYSNGAFLATFQNPGTGGWFNASSTSQMVSLSAGVQTFRLVALNGTQFNLFSLALTRQISSSQAVQSDWSLNVTPIIPPIPDITVNPRWMTSFTELDITGTDGNDTILVSQSGGTTTITANGKTQTVSGTFGDIAIWGGAGNDTITVDASVSTDARIYGGDGNNSLTDSTRGIATIVSYGNGYDRDTGNFNNTSFWVDRSDAVSPSPFEWNNGHVHYIDGFYQPFTNSPGASGYVTNAIDGANLADPAAGGGGTTRLSSSSFWGKGPVQEDINQGSIGDCYFLTALQSLARLRPDQLRQLAVDLGDGTYAIQFKRNGVTQYVRVDGDLPTWNAGGTGGMVYNHLGVSGNQWASIFEKAYAFFRTGANAYASIDTGWMAAVYTDFGIPATTFGLPSDQNTFYSTVTAALASNKPVDIGTLSTITGGAPLIAAHTYSVLAVSKDSNGAVLVTLRNPWGYDGFNVDSNAWDGIFTISYATLRANAVAGSILS